MKPKVALCIRGGVSLRNGAYHTQLVNGTLPETAYVSCRAVYNSVHRHIFHANPDFEFDVFIHSWSTDCETTLRSLYNPVAAVFESNNLYKDEIQQKCTSPTEVRTVSQALTIKKVLELQERMSTETSTTYEWVILIRPDVILWADLNLANYNPKGITVNGPGLVGDFHWVMTPFKAARFKGLYDAVGPHRPAVVHKYIEDFVVNVLKEPYASDTKVRAGHEEEVLRKVNEWPLRNGTVTYQILESYGLTRAEISSYRD